MSQPITDSPNALAPRRMRWIRLSFSLRALFVVVTVFGLWLGWQANLARQRRAILEAILTETDGMCDFRSFEEYDKAGYGASLQLYEVPRVSWIRRLCGDQTYFEITVPVTLTKTLLERLEAAFPESILNADIIEREGGKLLFTWTNNSRDSLLRPDDVRKANIGALFKTGKFE